jgi:hypothetical protein
VSSSSKRQQTVAQFITKAKYYALTKAVSKALWLRQIIGQIMYLGSDIKSVKLYGDNQGSLNLAKTLEFYQQTKHINVKHYFIQEHVTTKVIDL